MKTGSTRLTWPVTELPIRAAGWSWKLEISFWVLRFRVGVEWQVANTVITQEVVTSASFSRALRGIWRCTLWRRVLDSEAARGCEGVNWSMSVLNSATEAHFSSICHINAFWPYQESIKIFFLVIQLIPKLDDRSQTRTTSLPTRQQLVSMTIQNTSFSSFYLAEPQTKRCGPAENLWHKCSNSSISSITFVFHGSTEQKTRRQFHKSSDSAWHSITSIPHLGVKEGSY